MKIRALFFDQDGVIVDTERDGHRVAFNRAFREFGFDVEWDDDTYHGLLQVGGGKERMRHFLRTEGFGKAIPEEQADALIRKLHKRKTEIFISLIESGQLPLRPGVHRLMKEANTAGVVVAVCTTSNERAADAIVRGLLSDVKLEFVLAGDMVKRKKPDPEIYNMALGKTGFDPGACVVIEDSHIGTTAAKAAGCRVVATTSAYTGDEDLSRADLVVSCLGDAEEPAQILHPESGVDLGGRLDLRAIAAFFESEVRIRQDSP
jgi:HAD superfamily hydrolase (TIGR01509 family)